jgi:hypothetical protein
MSCRSSIANTLTCWRKGAGRTDVEDAARADRACQPPTWRSAASDSARGRYEAAGTSSAGVRSRTTGRLRRSGTASTPEGDANSVVESFANVGSSRSLAGRGSPRRLLSVLAPRSLPRPGCPPPVLPDRAACRGIPRHMVPVPVAARQRIAAAAGRPRRRRLLRAHRRLPLRRSHGTSGRPAPAASTRVAPSVHAARSASPPSERTAIRRAPPPSLDAVAVHPRSTRFARACRKRSRSLQ